MATVLCGDRKTNIPEAEALGEDLWIPQADLERASGWTLEPEGVCFDNSCVPIPTHREAEFLRPQAFNLSAFWRHLKRPVIHDEKGDNWVFGETAGGLKAALSSLQAPDFALPDLSGHYHSLSDYRGTKVFLATWASW